MSRKHLYTLSALYLYIPMAIFLVGWTPWWLGMPLAAAGLFLCLNIFKDVVGRVRLGSSLTEWTVAAVMLIWAVHAGIGEFAWQNRGDHLFRNAVFYTLCDTDWPSVSGSDMLCYYIGFWLPSATVAKLTGSMLLGRVMLVLWAAGGLWLVIRLVFEAIGQVKLRILWIFVFFSGIDIIPFYIYGHSIDRYLNAGWTVPDFGAYSPLAWWTDQLSTIYWIYNQIIPAWLGCMLVLGKAPTRAIPAVISFMLISSPIPSVALFPAGAYRWVRSAWYNTSSLKTCVRQLASWHLWIALILAIPIGLYFCANTSASTHTSVYTINSMARLAKTMIHIGLLLLFEIGVFIPFVWRYVKRDATFYILLATAVCALFVRTGIQGMDFASRASIPLILFMSVAVGRFATDWNHQRRAVRIAFICIALLALPGPMCEVARTTYKSLSVPLSEWADNGLRSIFDSSDYRDNFVAPASDWPLGPSEHSNQPL
ncbi:MAG: hypothetical protein C7K11_02835 [Candidatus Amulumruptor caecigallinarius]|uniref:Uncharacterized protein n=1 Tax=Candidatus Amulumruptor caecigallinarius TaxID=2109911 RepID=A0A4Q0UA04_9BACT|nr:MAG: hypothetical protein C7K11_02835 [Candidatus Amulumruptor caecigallinarius]HJE40149.1 hypothetical protein [Candidatus Amulumruptor caecigallinarius]